MNFIGAILNASKSMNSTSSAGRPVDKQKFVAFEKLRNLLKIGDEEMYSLNDLQNQATEIACIHIFKKDIEKKTIREIESHVFRRNK